MTQFSSLKLIPLFRYRMVFFRSC